MDEKKIKFLQDINNGTVKGAQKIIAQKLNISNTSVSLWFKGATQPSLDSILKISKLFNKSEQEIKEIFFVEDKETFTNTKDVELIKEKIKRFETEIDFLKTRVSALEKKK
ncbi:MAG: helix-turn-helix transcriptional regulator [Elusimicrobia bacterium]|nr:helix-turn-helix transcriptional regulator [Elusimicrobiota bacterium]